MRRRAGPALLAALALSPPLGVRDARRTAAQAVSVAREPERPACQRRRFDEDDTGGRLTAAWLAR